MGEGERQPIVAAILTCVCGRGDSLNLLTTNVMCFFFFSFFNNGKRFHSHSFGQFLQCFNLREFIESNTRYRQIYMQGQLYRYRYRCENNSFEFTARFTCGFMAWLNPPLNLYNSIYIYIYIYIAPVPVSLSRTLACLFVYSRLTQWEI